MTVRLFRHATISLVLAAAAVLMGSLTSHAQYISTDRNEIRCPDYKELGRWNRFRHEEAVDAVGFMVSKLVEERALSVEKIESEDQIRVLVSEKDSAVCQKLNERYSELLGLSRYFGDDYDSVHPAFQPLYLKYSNVYIAYFLPYYPEPEDGQPPAVGGGLSLLFIFDENMNLLHESSR